MWPALETRRLLLSLVACYMIVFGINKQNFEDLIEFTECMHVQPALITRSCSMLSQQRVIHINILFPSELCGTGIVFQGLYIDEARGT